MIPESNKWRDVPGYEGLYQCCAGGLIRSLKGNGRLMKTTRHRDGYDKLNMRDRNGKQRTFHVHTVIALTFLGPRPVGFFIDHIDGNHEHHAARNLRYVSPRDSSLNRKRAGESSQATGEPCVYRHGRGGFFVRVNPNGKKKRLGRFMTIEDAKVAIEKFRQLQRKAVGVVNG